MSVLRKQNTKFESSKVGVSFEAELGEKVKGRSLRIKREFTTIPKFKPKEPG